MAARSAQESPKRTRGETGERAADGASVDSIAKEKQKGAFEISRHLQPDLAQKIPGRLIGQGTLISPFCTEKAVSARKNSL
jgi:hypothetical protein